MNLKTMEGTEFSFAVDNTELIISNAKELEHIFYPVVGVAAMALVDRFTTIKNSAEKMIALYEPRTKMVAESAEIINAS